MTPHTAFGSIFKPALSVVALSVAICGEPGGERLPKPNIVLINLDDLDFDQSELWDFYDYRKFPSYSGAEMLGYTNDWKNGLSHKQPMLTPNIRSLAEEGCVFERFYMTSSLCTPSRYSLMTGQYASRSPALEKHFGKTEPAGFQLQSDLAPNQWAVARALQEAGYATGLVGKWHLAEPGSEERGFLVPAIPDADARDPTVAARIKKVYQQGCDYIKRNYGFDYAGAVYQHNANGLGLPQELVQSEHHMEWQTFHAKQFIDEYHDRPFFLYYAPTAPHGWYGGGEMGDPLDMPIEATVAGYTDEHIGAQPSREDVRRRIRENNIDPRNAMATWLDDSIGEVLKKLKEYGLEENTLVIFTSDHQSRGKFSVTEGCHVPFVARWPGAIPAGSRSRQLMANIDLAATLLELAGGKIPEDIVTDGLDMSPVFRGKTDWHVSRDLLLEVGYARAVVTDDSWKYTAIRLPEGKMPERDPASWREARALIKSKGEIPPAEDAPLSQEELDCMSYDGRIYYDRFTGAPILNQGPHRTFPHYADRDQLVDLTADPYEQENLHDNPEHAPKLKEMQRRLGEQLAKLPRHFGEFR
jgi:arylsulfatase A-like enzyme